MSWVVFDDVSGERMVVELQPTAIEVFRSRTDATVRMHLALVRIGIQGPDQQGAYAIDLVAPDGRVVTTLRVAEPWWSRLWPLLEQVRQAQVPFGVHGP
jgi:hypothetical protein